MPCAFAYIYNFVRELIVLMLFLRQNIIVLCIVHIKKKIDNLSRYSLRTQHGVSIPASTDATDATANGSGSGRLARSSTLKNTFCALSYSVCSRQPYKGGKT